MHPEPSKSVRISIIVPVFNTEKWLKECIQSLIYQTVPAYEIILINDCSTDNSKEIIEDFEKEYPSIKSCEFKTNHGLGYVRNRGIDMAKGDYILFVDSDDMLRTNALELLSNKVASYDYDAVYFEAETFGLVEYCHDSSYKRRIPEEYVDGVSGSVFFERVFPGSYYPSSCLCLYKRIKLTDGHILFPEGIRFEDTYFTFVYMMQANIVSMIKRPLYRRRYRAGSIMTSTDNNSRFIDFQKGYLLIFKYIDKTLNSYKNWHVIYQFLSNIYVQVLGLYMKSEKSDDFKEKLIVFAKCYKMIVEKQAEDIKKWNVGELLTYRRIMQLEKETEIFDCMESLSMERIEEYIEHGYEMILRKIPFDDESKVIAICGKGVHTKGFLKAYIDYVGDINAKLLYITSNESPEVYQNADYAIISSFVYEKEMLVEISKHMKTDQIITLYNCSIYRDIFARFVDGDLYGT